MLYSVTHELTIFALMMLCGAALGAVFDVLRALRRESGSGAVITNLADTVFWLAGGAGVVYVLLSFNDGILRIYEFIGIFLGALLYSFALSGVVNTIFSAVFGAIHKIISLFLKILLTPARFLYKILIGRFCALHILLINRRKYRNDKKKKEKAGTEKKLSAKIGLRRRNAADGGSGREAAADHRCQ